uniref:NTF2-related export protein n=1 Tax=Rhabditophanes sp. KR3021 TaxID=114890 RepID=A0AC35TIR1_9BILA
MAFNANYEQIGNAFVQHYYSKFDIGDLSSRAAGLSDLYDAENSYLTFEGNQCKGRADILAKVQSLTFGKIARAITKSDCQPLYDGSIAVSVFGQLQTDEDPVQSYNQFFILRPNNGSFFIANEIFRLVLHDH